MATALLNINVGDKYGKFTVIKEADRKIQPSGLSVRQVLCKCECGNERIVLLLHLTRNRVGCICRKHYKHAESKTPIYKLWRSMLWRCDPRQHQHSVYFDRGITVCQEWIDSYWVFKNWCAENGYKKGLQIDRKNNDLGYSPDNCRFVTSKQNCNNRRITRMVTYQGQQIPFMQLMDDLGLMDNHSTIRTRLNRGWTIEQAVNTLPWAAHFKRARTEQYKKQVKEFFSKKVVNDATGQVYPSIKEAAKSIGLSAAGLTYQLTKSKNNYTGLKLLNP